MTRSRALAPKTCLTRSARLRSLTIYLAAGWSGFFVMGIELLGGRLLAPYFGSSVFVWGGIITVFMACLSLGYLLGGYLSLSKPSMAVLGGLLLGEALLATPIFIYGSAVWEWLSYVVPDPRYGSLLGALSIFGLPTLIAGMVSPYAVRLLIANVTTSGQFAGRLYFASTFGSAAGTIVTSFYLVAWMRIDHIVEAFVSVTLAAGAVLLLLPANGEERAPRHGAVFVGADAERLLDLYSSEDAEAAVANCNIDIRKPLER